MGFEKVTINGIPTYYTTQFGAYSSATIVTYNQFWIYQSHQNLLYSRTYTTKYVGGYFYFSSDDYFYKTTSTFVVFTYYKSIAAYFKEILYDPASSKLYVAAQGLTSIAVFDLSCFLIQFINLGSRFAFGLAYFNGNLYATIINSNQILVIQNGFVIKYFNVNQCSVGEYSLVSITVDSFGYLAITCNFDKLIVVYDSNGNYMNSSIATSDYPFMTGIVYNGRFVIMTGQSLDIYY